MGVLWLWPARTLARPPACASPGCAVLLQGRGGSTGYDNAVALPARADSEELAKENNKSYKPLKGSAVFSVAKVRCGKAGRSSIRAHGLGPCTCSCHDATAGE